MNTKKSKEFTVLSDNFPLGGLDFVFRGALQKVLKPFSTSQMDALGKDWRLQINSCLIILLFGSTSECRELNELRNKIQNIADKINQRCREQINRTGKL